MRIFSFKDLETRYPDLFNRIKGYVLFASVLKAANKVVLNSHVKLQEILLTLKKIVVESHLLNNFTPFLHKIPQYMPLENPELLYTENETTLPFSEDMLESLAKLFQALFQEVVNGLAESMANILHAAGGSEEIAQQIAEKVSKQLMQNVINKVANSKANVPSFENIIKGEFVDQLQLSEMLVNEIWNDVLPMLTDANKLIYNFFASVDNNNPSAPDFVSNKCKNPDAPSNNEFSFFQQQPYKIKCCPMGGPPSCKDKEQPEGESSFFGQHNIVY